MLKKEPQFGSVGHGAAQLDEKAGTAEFGEVEGAAKLDEVAVFSSCSRSSGPVLR